jgi:hypothetical protein
MRNSTREYNFGRDNAWQMAAEKVENRTPYMTEWGDGSFAKTADDATAIWMAVKKAEKAGKDNNVDSEVKASLNGDRAHHLDRNFGSSEKSFEVWSNIKRHGSMFQGVVLGFALGVVFTNKLKIGRSP